MSSLYPNLTRRDGVPLTPRTPHSTRLHHGGLDDEVDMLLQSEPLLASTTDPSFPDDIHSHRHVSNERELPKPSRSRALRRDRWPSVGQMVSRAPLVLGVAIAMFLLFLVVVSIRAPDALLEYVSESKTPMVGSKHIIDYSAYESFPLTPVQYSTECWRQFNESGHRHGRYWMSHHDAPDVPHKFAPGVCSSSITYMLDGYVGLSADLALLAQVASFARERNRTLFVNDQFWNRGKWTDYFLDVRETQPGPEPGCLPPPSEELVSCPRSARHWIVNSRTAKFHFRHDFEEEYEDGYSRSTWRYRQIFENSASSLVYRNSTIRPNREMTTLIRRAYDDFGLSRGPYVAVHIRRGDRKAMSWRYQSLPGKYVPVDEFILAVDDTWARLTSDSYEQVAVQSGPSIFLASDSPDAISEFIKRARKLFGIRAKISTLRLSSDLNLKDLALPADYVQTEWAGESQVYRDKGKFTAVQRAQWTKGMIVDLALATGMWSDAVGVVRHPAALVCALPANLCKLGALSLGWKRSFEAEYWVEIDNNGGIEPKWQAFELFN